MDKRSTFTEHSKNFGLIKNDDGRSALHHFKDKSLTAIFKSQNINLELYFRVNDQAEVEIATASIEITEREPQ